MAAALLLAAAAVWYLGGRNAAPTDPSTWVYYNCRACGAQFHLDGREIDALLRRSGDGRRSLSPPAVRCKQCGSTETERERRRPAP